MCEAAMQEDLIKLNLLLAQRYVEEGRLNIAISYVNDARESLEELLESIKKAN